MRARSLLALAAFVAGIFVWCLPASASKTQATPALVFDARSGSVLHAERADAPWYPASLTKLMTAYLTFQAVKRGELALDTPIKVSFLATMQPPSKLGLPIGAEIRVQMALAALIVKSANDVAVMLAEAVGGDAQRFVVMMNRQAKALGMTTTHFANPNGLPDARQVTSARDLGLLARAIISDFPQYGYLFKKSSMRIGKRRLRSYNKLLRTFAGADGMKTGYICASGFNVVASATRDGRRLVAIVLGARSGAKRSLRTASLLQRGFGNELTAPAKAATLDALQSTSPQAAKPTSMYRIMCHPGGYSKARSRKKKAHRKATRKRRVRSARKRSSSRKTLRIRVVRRARRR